MGSVDDWFQATATNSWSAFSALGSGSVCFSNDNHFSNLTGPTWHWGGTFEGGQYGSVSSAYQTNNTDWPLADGYSNNAGLVGVSAEFTGVVGLSTWGVGVYGRKSLPNDDLSLIPNGLPASVVGTSTSWAGIIGWSTGWFGVEAHTINGEAAVLGIAENGVGVWAISGNNGPQVPNTSNVATVFATSDRQHGVIGTSNKSVGVIGFSNNIGVLGYTTTPGAFAGQFIGDVSVTGNLTVGGRFNLKGCAVPFPDGTYRTLYCMESPEVWFEDFGAAKLKRGRMIVKLDVDFAKVIKRGDYKVFLTPEGDCRGLYVRRKSAANFEVRELAGGKSSVTSSAGARTSGVSNGSPSSNCAHLCPPRGRASPCRRRACARSSPEWKRRRGRACRRSRRKAKDRACGEMIGGPWLGPFREGVRNKKSPDRTA
jgi:hypothetical protein